MSLKRIRAGAYASPDGAYYAVRDESNSLWVVGVHTPKGDLHIVDLPRLADARANIEKMAATTKEHMRLQTDLVEIYR
jgi:hypothetical protein